MESAVHAAVPLRVGKKMRKRRELDALVSGPGSRGGRLLSASSDEGEPWGRRTTRRRRSRPFVRLAAALALCVCVVSAATVLWLFVDVRRQIVSLRIEMDRVSMSSAGVGDALQICHSTAKEMRANTTTLNDRITKLELQHADLITRVNDAVKTLSEVSEQLSAAPKLADTPRRLAELQRTVADFGSQISGFDGALTSAKKQAVAAAAGVEEMRTLLRQLDARTNDTIANITTAAGKQEEEIKGTLVALNATVTHQVEELRTRVEDISAMRNKAESPAVAAPSSPVVTSSTALPVAPISVTTSSTTSALPGPPAKPSVTQ